MFFSARGDSLVIDEKVHIPAGYLHVWQGDYTFNTEHPPLLNDLAGLFAKIAKPNLPEEKMANFNGGDQWEYGDLFFYKSGNNVEKIIFWARLPFIFLTLGLIYLVYLWAKTLFGPKAGLLAAVLTAFSPNILAHGHLATTDIGVTFFFVLTCWLLRKYFLKPTWGNAALLGLSLGLVLLAKFSGLVVLPIIFLGLIYLWFLKKPKLLPALGQFLMIILIPLILLWLLYAFSLRGELTNLPPVYELSKTLGYHTISHPYSRWLLIPFDKFIQGLEILSDHNASGHWAYLNGQISTSGWWYYFPLVLWYKLTITEIILFALSIFFGWRFLKKTDGWFEGFLLIFPPLLYLGISMIGKIDIGIRHVLPILPFFYILISRMIQNRHLILKPIIILLVIGQILIGLLAFPNYLAYFNQIAGGAKGGIKHLADSNLDWNQNMKRFQKYAREHHLQKVYELCWDSDSFTYYGIENEILPNTPVKGVVVICAQQLKVTPEGFDISWVTNPPTGGPADEVVANGIYVWRFK